MTLGLNRHLSSLSPLFFLVFFNFIVISINFILLSIVSVSDFEIFLVVIIILWRRCFKFECEEKWMDEDANAVKFAQTVSSHEPREGAFLKVSY